MIREKIKDLWNGYNKYIFLVCILYSCLFFGVLIIPQYYNDTYSALSHSVFEHIFFDNSRPIMALFFILVEKTPFYFSYEISFISAILFLSLATFRYASFMAAELNETQEIRNIQAVVLGLISCFTIGNILIIEYFMFIEMGMFMLTVLLMVESSINMICFLKNSDRKKLINCICLSVAAVLIYQIIIGLLLVLTLPFILIYSKSFVEYIKKQATVVIAYGMTMVIPFTLQMTVAIYRRIDDVEEIMIQPAKDYKPKNVSAVEYFFSRITPGMWAFAFICVIIAVVLSIRVAWQNEQKEILKGLFIAVVVIGVGTLAYTMKLTVDFNPRLYYPLGTLPGILLVYGVLKGFIHLPSLKDSRMVICLLSLFLLVQFIDFMGIFIDRYQVNFENEYLAKLYGVYIEEYEEETGISIEYVTFYEDELVTRYRNGWRLTKRVFSNEAWCRLTAMNYYLNTSYKNGEYNEEIAKQYESKDYDVFSKDMIQFRGNSAHICVY